MAGETMADATHPSDASVYLRLPAHPHADSQPLAIDLEQFRGNSCPLERFAPGPVVNLVQLKLPVECQRDDRRWPSVTFAWHGNPRPWQSPLPFGGVWTSRCPASCNVPAETIRYLGFGVTHAFPRNVS